MVFIDENNSHFSRRNIFDLCPWVIPKNHAVEPSSFSFRLFELYSGEPDDEVRGRLVTFNYDEVPGFNFVSHLAHEDQFEPDVDFAQPTVINTHIVNLPAGLRSAFRRLRQTGCSNHLFVPFLCVNELDNNEKSYYWLNLRHIIDKATLCTVWLGEPSDGESSQTFDALFSFLRAIYNHRDRRGQVRVLAAKELEGKGIRWLCSHPIWGYLPTIAEISLSEIDALLRHIDQLREKKAFRAINQFLLDVTQEPKKLRPSKTYITYGKRSIPFSFCRALCNAVNSVTSEGYDYALSTIEGVIVETLENRMISKHPDLLERLCITGFWYFPPIQGLLWFSQFFDQAALEYGGIRAQTSEQTKTEMVINALYSVVQGTAGPTDGTVVRTWDGIDYSKGNGKLMYDYVKRVGDYNNDMSYLFLFPRFSPVTYGVPSWVPSVEGTFEYNGISQPGWEGFTPCKDRIEGKRSEVKDFGVYSFKGEIVTTVGRVIGPCQTEPDCLKANFDASGKFMGSASMEDLHDFMVERFRDRFRDKKSAQRQLFAMLMQRTKDEPADAEFIDRGIQLWNNFTVAEKVRSRVSISDEMMQKFEAHFLPMTGQSVFVATMTDRNLCAMGPSTTKPGDLVALVYGCRYPVVLRHQAHPAGKRAFQFVGAAFVDGAMEGECYRGKPKNLILV